MSSIIPEFGIKRENEERRDGGCGVVFDPQTKKYAVNEHLENGLLGLPGGGVDPDEDIQVGVLREITEESGLDDFLHIERIAEALTHYYNILKKVNRVAKATCFLVILKSKHQREIHREAHENFILTWASADEIMKNLEAHNHDRDHDHWIYFLKKAINRIHELGYDQPSEV